MVFPARRIELEMAAEDLLEASGTHCYPIRVMDIAQWMGAELFTYSQLDETSRGDAILGSPDALSYRSGSRSLICYNDDVLVERKRFSMTHEIAHIWLDHRNQTRENEREANYFAGYLLAPHPIIIAHKLWDDIQTCMWVSSKCASVAFAQAYARSVENRGFEAYELEIIRLVKEIGGVPCQKIA